MIKAKGLHPKKYRVGTWSKANMKWTRAEDLAASWKRSKEEAVLKEEAEKDANRTLNYLLGPVDLNTYIPQKPVRQSGTPDEERDASA
jgi:hypothetical protein